MDGEINFIEEKYYTKPAVEMLDGNGLTSLNYWAKVMYKKEMDPDIKQIYNIMLIKRESEECRQNPNYWDFDNYFRDMVKKLIRRYNAV